MYVSPPLLLHSSLIYSCAALHASAFRLTTSTYRVLSSSSSHPLISRTTNHHHITMPRIIGLGLRALEFAFTVILLGLIGSLEANSGGNPESVHFSMFTAAFSALFLIYLIPATWTESFTGHPILPIILDALNVVFTFCAAVTLAARTKAKSCSNSVRFPFVMFSGYRTNHALRPSSIPMKLPWDPSTAAVRLRQPAPSSGSSGLATWEV